jgi:long-subunit fatty acid transport protein
LECRKSLSKNENNMKRISLTILAAFTIISGLFAQNVDDALRYSQVFYGGTARFMSMGGAFTALGGDISSLSQNPAGIGVFRSSEMSVTPQLNYINSTAGYHGNTSDYLYNFNLSQAGFVSNIMSSNNATGLLKLNFGYSFNKTNNLHQSTLIQGINNTSSMADSWAGSASQNGGTIYSDLSGPEGIAYDTWIIDTITGSGGRLYETVFSNYGDNPPSKYGQSVSRLISNEGFTGEHAISIGGNYSDKVYFGATFGISQLRYVSQFQHSESANSSMASLFKNFNYLDYYEDKGTGYSFKLGAIFKPVESMRIGVAFHSPVWYHIDEYFFETMSSNFTDGNRYESSNDPMRFNYALTTPFRVLGGIAIQIQKFALLSADYEFVDYSMAKFSNTKDTYNYSEKNTAINNSLRSTSNFRVGGEFRFNKLYLRSGYGYYGKAFRPGEDNANLDYNSISGGIGFRERNFSFDFGYTHMGSTQVYYLYPLDETFEPAKVNITNNQNMFTLTFGYKFGF